MVSVLCDDLRGVQEPQAAGPALLPLLTQDQFVKPYWQGSFKFYIIGNVMPGKGPCLSDDSEMRACFHPCMMPPMAETMAKATWSTLRSTQPNSVDLNEGTQARLPDGAAASLRLTLPFAGWGFCDFRSCQASDLCQPHFSVHFLVPDSRGGT